MPPVVIDLRTADDLRDVVHRAVQALVEGGLVAFPTETVYGVAASALDAAAVQRLVDVKGRGHDHPMAMALKSAEEAIDYAPHMNRLARRLARRCWPGPITLVVDDFHPESLVRRLPKLVQEVVVPGGTVGLRVPAHQIVLDVLQMLAGPLVLTSANKTGKPASTTAEQVIASVGESLQLVLDDGPSRYGQPSSVVHVLDDGYEILREGVIGESTLRRLSSTILLFVCTGNTCRSPMAEVLAQQLLAKRLGCSIDALAERGVLVRSAGIAAIMGGRATAEAVHVLSELGLDLSGHESQPLTEQLVRHADFIYTMTHSHRLALLSQWPEAAQRTFVLCPDESDVADPIGGPPELYRTCAEQIAAALEVRMKDIPL